MLMPKLTTGSVRARRPRRWKNCSMLVVCGRQRSPLRAANGDIFTEVVRDDMDLMAELRNRFGHFADRARRTVVSRKRTGSHHAHLQLRAGSMTIGAAKR